MALLDNFDVAVLTIVNALAERYGIMPHEFSAGAESSESQYRVVFDTPDPCVASKFDQMMCDMGLDPDGDAAPELSGREQDVWRTLSEALRKAPRSRRR